MNIVVQGLVWVAVGLTLFCCVGTLVVRTSLERLHFMAPVVALALLFLGISVALTSGLGTGVAKILFTMVLLVLTNSVLSHATARAGRIRDEDTWLPSGHDRVEENER